MILKALTSITLSLSFFFASTLYGQDASQLRIHQTLDQMVAQGILPKVEAQKLKDQMSTLTPEQWEHIHKTAESITPKLSQQIKLQQEQKKNLKKEQNVKVIPRRAPASIRRTKGLQAEQDKEFEKVSKRVEEILAQGNED